jgi:hypothetical protein
MKRKRKRWGGQWWVTVAQTHDGRRWHTSEEGEKVRGEGVECGKKKKKGFFPHKAENPREVKTTPQREGGGSKRKARRVCVWGGGGGRAEKAASLGV